MIHNNERVSAIRTRMAAQIELIKSLQAQIVKGKLDTLDLAINQTQDVETFFLADLNRNDRTPSEEAQWLSAAEHMLSIWGPYLRNTKEHFDKHGGHGIEVI